ncbi:MAG: hypothetical protein K6A94_02165 [Bacteroidales bacterium]|nr:hypothetical protein [Bacteroidales bacterium]
MKKVIMMVPDEKMALVVELSKAITDMEIVEVNDVDSIVEFQRKSPMERFDFAIHAVVSEKGLMANQYDYAWLYAMVQKEQLKGVEKFRSVDSFRQYLINVGIKDVPSNSTISGRYGCLRHKFPDWVFSDGCDATEAQRRINIAKRFLCLFMKGK